VGQPAAVTMLSDVLLAPVEGLRRLWLALANQMIDRRIARCDQPVFSAGYWKDHCENWDRHLAPWKGRPDLRFLEIGCFEGGSTLWFLDNVLTAPGSSIVCIDTFVRQGGEPRFRHNVRVSGHSARVRVIKGRSDVAMSRLHEQRFDVIYIDGSHRAADVMLDAVQAWPMLRRGGLLIFDDYAWQPELPPQDRPRLAIDAFLRAFSAEYELLHKEYQVIVRKNASPG